MPSNVPHKALALEDTLDVDVFTPPRQDWLDGTDDYLRGRWCSTLFSAGPWKYQGLVGEVAAGGEVEGVAATIPRTAASLRAGHAGKRREPRISSG